MLIYPLRVQVMWPYFQPLRKLCPTRITCYLCAPCNAIKAESDAARISTYPVFRKGCTSLLFVPDTDDFIFHSHLKSADIKRILGLL